MGNKFLYDTPKEKLIDETRTKAMTPKTLPVHLGNNWYSLVINITGHFFFLRRDIWESSGYYLTKNGTSGNHTYNRASQATIIHTYTSEIKFNHGPTPNNWKLRRKTKRGGARQALTFLSLQS